MPKEALCWSKLILNLTLGVNLPCNHTFIKNTFDLCEELGNEKKPPVLSMLTKTSVLTTEIKMRYKLI